MSLPTAFVLVGSTTMAGLQVRSARDPERVFYSFHMRGLARGGFAVGPLDRQDATVAILLLGRAGGVVTLPEAVDALYGHRSDGGPLDAAATAKARVARLRVLLVGLGLTIDRASGGYFVRALSPSLGSELAA